MLGTQNVDELQVGTYLCNGTFGYFKGDLGYFESSNIIHLPL